MKNWYEIKAQAQPDQPTEVFIYDEIGGWGITAAQFVRDMKTLGDRPLNIRINSPGGSVFDGLAIYHYLAARPNVTVTVDGIAASIASIIAMAGTKRVMPESAYLMIHNPWTGAIGDAKDLREQADLLDKLGETLAGIYAKVTKKGKETIRAMMDAETWIDGATALSDGFVTDLSNAQPINAKIRADRFTHTPAALIQAAAPAELSVEDCVGWNEAGGMAYGEIVEVYRDGVLEVPDAGIRVDASAADPAALIKRYQPIAGTDAFIEGDILVGMNFSQLTKVENLKVVETEDNASKVGSIQAVSKTAPQAARRAFDKGVRQVEDGKGGDGLEAATVREARSLKAGEVPTDAKIRKAYRWWARNERFLQAEADSPADVAANLWGGAAGRDWFRSLYAQLEQDQSASTDTHNTQTQPMNKLMEALAKAGLISSVDLAEDAAITEFENNVATLLKAKADADAKLAEQAKARIVAVVDEAVTAGRIKAEVKDAWVAQILADAKAAELLAAIPVAQIGAAPLGAPVAPSNGQKTSAELRAEFDAITDPKQRTAFWSAHKAQLLKK